MEFDVLSDESRAHALSDEISQFESEIKLLELPASSPEEATMNIEFNKHESILAELLPATEYRRLQHGDLSGFLRNSESGMILVEHFEINPDDIQKLPTAIESQHLSRKRVDPESSLGVGKEATIAMARIHQQLASKKEDAGEFESALLSELLAVSGSQIAETYQGYIKMRLRSRDSAGFNSDVYSEVNEKIIPAITNLDIDRFPTVSGIVGIIVKRANSNLFAKRNAGAVANKDAWRFENGHTVKDIAKETNRSEAAVQKNILIARLADKVSLESDISPNKDGSFVLEEAMKSHRSEFEPGAVNDEVLMEQVADAIRYIYENSDISELSCAIFTKLVASRLGYGEMITQREIADQFEVSIGTVQKTWKEVRDKLAVVLHDQFDISPKMLEDLNVDEVRSSFTEKQESKEYAQLFGAQKTNTDLSGFDQPTVEDSDPGLDHKYDTFTVKDEKQYALLEKLNLIKNGFNALAPEMIAEYRSLVAPSRESAFGFSQSPVRSIECNGFVITKDTSQAELDDFLENYLYKTTNQKKVIQSFLRRSVSKLKRGEGVASYQEIAEMNNVNRATVSYAINSLVNNGEQEQGSMKYGADFIFVCGEKITATTSPEEIKELFKRVGPMNQRHAKVMRAYIDSASENLLAGKFPYSLQEIAETAGVTKYEVTSITDYFSRATIGDSGIEPDESRSQDLKIHASTIAARRKQKMKDEGVINAEQGTKIPSSVTLMGVQLNRSDTPEDIRKAADIISSKILFDTEDEKRAVDAVLRNTVLQYTSPSESYNAEQLAARLGTTRSMVKHARKKYEKIDSVTTIDTLSLQTSNGELTFESTHEEVDQIIQQTVFDNEQDRDLYAAYLHHFIDRKSNRLKPLDATAFSKEMGFKRSDRTRRVLNFYSDPKKKLPLSFEFPGISIDAQTASDEVAAYIESIHANDRTKELLTEYLTIIAFRFQESIAPIGVTEFSKQTGRSVDSVRETLKSIKAKNKSNKLFKDTVAV